MVAWNAQDFEDEVRRVARALWSPDAFGGAEIVEGRERDGVFRTQDAIHVVEATVSRKKDKAAEDGKKLRKLCEKLGRSDPLRAVKGWFVTADEPTADQRREIERLRTPQITAVSFDGLRAMLIDAREYLSLRDRYPYGSARDPESGDVQDLEAYVPLDIYRRDTDDSNELWSVSDIAGALRDGGTLALIGDYGSGKSMTMREIYQDLAGGYRRSTSQRFPVYLNLREHTGQDNPAEALLRHANRIGFAQASQLVRAWRAGDCILLLDGFDEMAARGWTRRGRRLRLVRHQSMTLVRNFLSETPSRCGVVLAGREHYFDTDRERSRALGLGVGAVTLSLSEFNEEQIAEYLRARNWDHAVPAWLPSRPLLLGYLASRGLLQDTLSVTVGSSPARGWNELLDRICEREAAIDVGIDGTTVRQLIEHMATRARGTTDGLGPVSFSEIRASFERVCGYPPDDSGMLLLQRLPGLGGTSSDEDDGAFLSQDDSRMFVDSTLVDVARVGDVARYIEFPYDVDWPVDPSDWHAQIGPIGQDLGAFLLNDRAIPSAKISVAASHAMQNGWDCVAADIVAFVTQFGGSVEHSLSLSGVWMEGLSLSSLADLDADLHRVEFVNSVLHEVDLEGELDRHRLPTFRNCSIGVIVGRTGERDLPDGCFIDCDIEEFSDDTATTGQILALTGLSVPERVLLTVLKKLYVQRGSGRKQSALFRGLDERSRGYVEDVLSILSKENLAIPSRQGAVYVWLPNRSQTRRVLQVLEAPTSSKDPILAAAREVGS